MPQTMQAAPWILPELAPLVATLTEPQILGCTLYGEARSERIEGLVGVGWVIRNRVMGDLHDDRKPDWWGEGYRGVCLAPRQFSCWNPVGGARNYERLTALVKRLADQTPVQEAAARECLYVAHGVIGTVLRDPTKGATHYHAATMNPRPVWARNLVPLVQLGGHVFYRL